MSRTYSDIISDEIHDLGWSYGYGSVRDMHTEEDFIIADAHKNGVRVKVKGPMLQGALMALLEAIVKVEGNAISMN